MSLGDPALCPGPNPTWEVPISSSNTSARLNLDRPINLRTATDKGAQKRSTPAIQSMQVRHHDDGWALLIDDLGEPAWVVSTKAKAVKAARGAARFHKARLEVFTRAGDCNKVYEPTAA